MGKTDTKKSAQMNKEKEATSIEEILGKAGLINHCCNGHHYDTESDSAKRMLKIAQKIYDLGYKTGREDYEHEDREALSREDIWDT